MQHNSLSLFREEAIEWAALTEVLDSHPDSPLTAGSDPWHSAEVYAHLARWFSRAADDLQALAAGRETTFEADADSINATWRREDRSLSLTAARNRATGARWRLLMITAETPRTQWSNAFIETFHAATRQHYREHQEAITRLPGRVTVANPSRG